MTGERDPYRDFTRTFFDRWSPLYDLFAKPIGFAYRRAVRAAGAAPGRTILDLCTGTGEIAIRCALAGAEVTAVDMTPSMLERARGKGRGLGIHFALMDARQLAFADATFDAVVLSFALHDMPRFVRPEVLREAARVAREEVIVLDYDPPRRQPWRKLVVSLISSFESPYFTAFVNDGLERSFAEAGLVARATYRPLRGFFAVNVLPRPKPVPRNAPPRKPKPQQPVPIRRPA